jgi:hypothetical protein
MLHSLLSLNILFCHRRKFKGITSKPKFCQAIYQSFENHQAISGEDLTVMEKSEGELNFCNNEHFKNFFPSIF